MRDFPKPQRPGLTAAAKHWRGTLFWEFRSPLMWRDKWEECYETVERPHAVTFPICEGCGHIIWNWPHFEEEVPKHALCDECAEEDLQAEEDDRKL